MLAKQFLRKNNDSFKEEKKKTGKRWPLGCSDLVELRAFALTGTQSKRRQREAKTAMV